MNYRWIVTYINCWRSIPVYWMALHCKFSDKIKKDIAVWKRNNMSGYNKSDCISFAYMMMDTKEFRNVIFNRLHRNPVLFCISRILFKPLDSLYINMPPENIGGGLYFQHGFSTIVAAKKIGDNVSINQQVTIGYNGDEAPIIGDGVIVCAGAIIIGNVAVGNGAVIGAGSVVKHNVDEKTIVAGVPAKPVGTKKD